MDTLKKLKDKKTKIEKIPTKKGDSNKNFISTNLSIQYLSFLFNEKNLDGYRYYLTEELILSNNSDKTVKEVGNKLLEKYIEILKNDKFVDGIYTVINASEKELGYAHQNWIFFDTKNNHIIRYEPNGIIWAIEYEKKIRIQDVLRIVEKELKSEIKMSNIESINYFDGCRATSTLLAMLDIAGMTLKDLKTNDYLSLAYIISKEIENLPYLKQLPRIGSRTQKGMITYTYPK